MIAGQRCLFSWPDGWWRWWGRRQGPQEPVTMLHRNIFQNIFQRLHSTSMRKASHGLPSSPKSPQQQWEQFNPEGNQDWGWKKLMVAPQLKNCHQLPHAEEPLTTFLKLLSFNNSCWIWANSSTQWDWLKASTGVWGPDPAWSSEDIKIPLRQKKVKDLQNTCDTLSQLLTSSFWQWLLAVRVLLTQSSLPKRLALQRVICGIDNLRTVPSGHSVVYSFSIAPSFSAILG